MSPPIFIGIDVSQTRLDMAVHPGVSLVFTHDESAIAKLVEQLQALHPTLIVLEAPAAWKFRSPVPSPLLDCRWS